MPEESFEDRPWLQPPAPTVWDIPPGPGAEIVFRGKPATVVRVENSGQIRSAVDLVMVTADGSTSDLHRSVPHAVGPGWSWPEEPPPSDPTPADRLQLAQAAGLNVPSIGSRVALVCARPRSIRGTAYVGVPALVEAVHDAIFGPAWESALATRATATNPSDYRRYDLNPFCQILLRVAVLHDADLTGLEGIRPGQKFDLVTNFTAMVPVWPHNSEPRPVTEGWALSFPETIVPNPQVTVSDCPCERCGASGPRSANINMVRFFVDMPLHRISVTAHSPQSFARTCVTCAEEIGRFACQPIPPRIEPASVPQQAAAGRLDNITLDDITRRGEGADGA